MSAAVKSTSGLNVPYMGKCCFCFSLKFGSLAIAACSVLFWIFVLFDILTVNRYNTKNAVESGVARLLIDMVLATLMFIGAQKRMSLLILLWVLVEFVLILVNVVLALVVGIMQLSHVMLLGAAIIGTFYTLALIVVFNFYREVRDGQ
ncbi:uncharacterized protein LOC124370928 [Homalodisca vitripennis]|uniref:uncharacterized protein LOC124370928 n=1 Tax=Homalodisca vitripennis TaxID=197043 RepID=UPI001EEB8B1C|nr:uncharacterized protein LOC124370928 [Homalodisca vitripennis]